MKATKHVGRVKNTGRRCIVVFREIYDENGHVIDDSHCLVLETESLPDAEHQDIIRIVESEPAQGTGDVYNIFARSRLGNGSNALNWMVNTKRLRKFATNNVELLPNANTSISLDTLNKIVKMQKSGASQEDIQRVLQNDTDLPPREMKEIAKDNTVNETPVNSSSTETGNEDVMDDAALAKSYIAQADVFEQQAQELRNQAYELDSSLKPKKTITRKTTSKKEPAN